MSDLATALQAEWGKLSCAVGCIRNLFDDGFPPFPPDEEADAQFWGSLLILEESLPRLYELKMLSESYAPRGEV